MAKVQKAKIVVSKAFKHNVEGVLKDYPVGTHVVDKAVADHWYVQEHSEVIDTFEEDDAKPAAAGKDKADKKQQAQQQGDGQSAAADKDKAAG